MPIHANYRFFHSCDWDKYYNRVLSSSFPFPACWSWPRRIGCSRGWEIFSAHLTHCDGRREGIGQTTIFGPRLVTLWTFHCLMMSYNVLLQVEPEVKAQNKTSWYRGWLVAILDSRRVLLCFEVLGALFSPFHYVIGVFNFIWAIMIALIDGEASWFAKCGNCRATLFQWFPVFGTLPGRSFLHFYAPRLKELFMSGTFGTLRFIYENIAIQTESARHSNEL